MPAETQCLSWGTRWLRVSLFYQGGGVVKLDRGINLCRGDAVTPLTGFDILDPLYWEVAILLETKS